MRKKRNKRLRKKGLSAVITTLVIIVLVLVSTGTIWVVIKNVISEQAREISLGKFSTDLSIKSVKVEGELLSIGVERDPGKGDIIRLKFIFENGTDSEIIERVTDIEALDEKSFTFRFGELTLLGIKKVSIVPIYGSDTGEEVSGDIIDVFELEKRIRGEEKWQYIGNFEKLGYKGSGIKEYSVSSQSEDIVKIKKAIVDPLDVLPGDNQIFTVHVTSPHGVTEVTTTTELDNSVLDLDLEEIGVDEDGNQIFSATWTVNDVHTTTYVTTIIATDSEGNSDSLTLTWTDACQSALTHGADRTMSASCSTGASTIAGLDGGSITLGAGVNVILDAGSRLIFNDGKSITITASGASITSTTTGSFGNGNLYYTDADADGYAPNAVMTVDSGGIRAMSASGTSDCQDTGGGAGYVSTTSTTTASDNDQDGYTDTSGAGNCRGTSSQSVGGRTYYRDTSGGYSWVIDSQKLGTSDCDDTLSDRYITRTCYYDGDGDGHTVGSGTSRCKAASCASPSDSYKALSSPTDCCDTEANANPDQTAYFSTAISGAGCTANYDYNCDSSETKQYRASPSCYNSVDDCPNNCWGYYQQTGSPVCGSSANYNGATIGCDGSVSRTQACR